MANPPDIPEYPSREWNDNLPDPAPERRTIHTVSELTSKIKQLLEDRFPFIWIQGEISNLRIPGSGHCYFTLKDEKAQIPAVMFRGLGRQVRLIPEDGMRIVGFGRISVFEPRGTYQIILEHLEPAGIGALQLAFEALKKRLAHEGYFDPRHKKKLPFLPRKISIVTSPTGAVVHDIITVVSRRFPRIHLEIVPVRVQGAGAEAEIVQAVEWVNRRGDSDIIIIARGGGSLEDLQPFNSESLAMAIFNSGIPVISAVGHETDFTIADFIADLRAATPSAAAELAVPDMNTLARSHAALSGALLGAVQRRVAAYKRDVAGLQKRLSDPRKKVQLEWLRVDDLAGRLTRLSQLRLRQEKQRLEWWVKSLNANSPAGMIQRLKQSVDSKESKIISLFVNYISHNRLVLREKTAKLEALSPLGILRRGYSITRSLPDRRVILDPDRVQLAQEVEVRVAEGVLFCTVKGKFRHGKEDF
jgi:exodeoxyribonuclease VII large subunit